MKNIVHPKKKFSKTEYEINSIKKNTKNNEEDSEELSNAYRNINALLSNCIESIRREEKDNDNMNNSLFKNVSGYINKNQVSSNKINKIIKSSFTNNKKKIDNFNKSNTLSNSNTFLIKTSEENLLKSINMENDGKKRLICQKKTSPLKLNKKKTILSETSYNINIKTSILDDKVNNNNHSTKNNTLIAKNSKLKNSKSNKHVFFGHKKDDDFFINKELSSFNVLNKNFTIRTKGTKSSLKTNKTIKAQNNKINRRNEFNGINFNFNSNIESFSPKSIKNIKAKKIKKVVFKEQTKEQKIKRRKKKLNTFGYISKEFKKELDKNCVNFSKINLSKKSVLSDEKSPKTLNKINSLKKPKTFSNTFIINEKMIDNYLKKNTNKSIKPVKNSKKDMKILTLEQIEKNVKQSLIGINLTEVKKELYDLENNDISEVIRNLPTKKFGNDIVNKSSVKSNNINKVVDLNNSKELKSESSKSININQNNYRKLFIVRKVYDSLDDEEIGDEEVSNFYLDPHCFTIYFIDSLIIIFSFLELFYLPLFLGYKNNYCRDNLSFESLFFYSIDFIYIIDLMTGFFRAYYNFEEFLIRNNIDIIINYLKSWFIFDFIEAIPFYTLLNFHEKKCNEITINYIYNVNTYKLYYTSLLIKLLKIFKTFDHNKAMDKINDFLNNNEFFNNWNGVISNLLLIVSLLHFCSCIFIFLGKVFQPGWIVIKGIQNQRFSYIYITAIYYLMTTLTTVGYGDISVETSQERYYQIIILLVGTCAYSWILTFISNYIKKINERYIDFENKVKILREIRISYPLLKNELYEKIIRYLKYNKSENKYNVDYILDSLPLSLKNNVIIDMYKPIIKNFQFFKSFQNSDFFVKIVTSLKPVLSIKDDILIQEGDVIEDIIFIKKGVLSLEIYIDLDNAQESCEARLNPNGASTIFHQPQSIRTAKGFNSQSLISSNINYSKLNTLTKKAIIKSNRKQMNIINLRKNEHYGDVLMILNERSPLTVKVKSKKAELFFLQKTEATEISNKYPNIWKRIVRKSLYNMNKIKSLIKKKIIIFCDLNGIWISPDLRKKANVEISEEYNSFIENLFPNNKNINLGKTCLISKNRNETNKSKKSFNQSSENKLKENQINSIIYEVDENIESNRNSYINQNKNINNSKNFAFRFSNKKERNSDTSNFFSSNNIKSGLKSFLNKSFVSQKSFKNNKKESENKDSLLLFNNSNSSNSISNKKKIKYDSLSKQESSLHVRENIKEISNKSDKTNKNNEMESNKNLNLINKKLNKMLTAIEEKIKPNSGQINNLNINFVTYKNVNFPFNIKNVNRRFSEPNISINNKYSKYSEEDNEINEEIYSNEDFNINIEKENMNCNTLDKNDKIIYPYLNFYFNNQNNNLNEFNLSKLLEKNKTSLIKEDIETKISKNCDLIKSSGFSNLYTTSSISFSIDSIYYNVNKLTGYRIQKDALLQQKIKNYILDECFFQTNSINCKKINNFNAILSEDKKKKMVKKFGSFQPVNTRNSVGKSNSYIGINNDDTPKHKKIKMRNSLKLRQKRIDSMDNSNIINKFHQNHKSLIDFDKSQKNRKSKRRRSINFRQIYNSSILNYSNLSNRNSSVIQDDNNFYFKKKTTSKRTAIKLNDDEEMSFYARMKTIRNKNNKNEDNTSISFISNPKKFSLMDQISQNIQNNKQNLNNPEEYYNGFFSNILQRRKTISKKQFKATKKPSNYNIMNYNNIKRTSTSSEAIHRNNINSKFKI